MERKHLRGKLIAMFDIKALGYVPSYLCSDRRARRRLRTLARQSSEVMPCGSLSV
jgi:hypothetical protein